MKRRDVVGLVAAGLRGTANGLFLGVVISIGLVAFSDGGDRPEVDLRPLGCAETAIEGTVVNLCQSTIVTIEEKVAFALGPSKGFSDVTLHVWRHGTTVRASAPDCGFVGWRGEQRGVGLSALKMRPGVYEFRWAPALPGGTSRWIQTGGPPLVSAPGGFPCQDFPVVGG